MQILRSVSAVVVGIGVFSISLLAGMSAGNLLLGAEPEWINRSVTTQIVWLMWNVVSMVGGGYVAAVIAARAPTTHAVIMGAIQTLFTLGALLTVTGNATPMWLWLAGIAATAPAAWMGARLRTG